MTREEARERLRGILTEAVEFENSVCYVTEEDREPLEMAIKALEQEPCDVFDEYGNYKYPSDVELTEPNTATSMPCEDAISREKLLKVITGNSFKSDYPRMSKALVEIIKVLPSVTQKSGKWIKHPEIETSAPKYLMFYECSECGDKQCFCKLDIHKKRFCSNCGAKMVEPQERSDKK